MLVLFDAPKLLQASQAVRLIFYEPQVRGESGVRQAEVAPGFFAAT